MDLISSSKSKWNKCLFWLGIAALFCQLFVLLTYAVNIPWADEWGGASFYPGMQTRKFNPDFLLAFHNEHRILWTKLSFWVAYKLSNLNLISLLFFNFLLFSVMIISLVIKLEKETNFPLSFSILLLACVLPIENHHMAFQNQFHFAILFFILGAFTFFSQSRVKWLSPFLIGGSIFAMGSGVAFAIAYLLVVSLSGLLKVNSRTYSFYCISITGVFLLFWFQNFPSSLHQGFITSPFTFNFWNFLLNLVGLGFGYREYSIIPGIFWSIILLFLFWSYYDSLVDKKRFLQGSEGVIFLLALGVASVLLIISYSRGGSGPEFSKGSRYSEIALLLVPVTIVMFEYLFINLKIRKANLVRIAIYIIIFIPFANKYSFNTEYKKAYSHHKTAKECINRYYRGEGDGICDIPIRAELKEHLNFAKKLKLTFAAD